MVGYKDMMDLFRQYTPLPSRNYPDSFECCESVVREICLQISMSVFMKKFLSIPLIFSWSFFGL